MCRKITALLLSVTMLLAMTVCLNACKDDGTHSPFTQQSYRTDTDPLKSRFPALGEIERAYWKTYIFGRGLYSCIGPTSYRLTGFVSTDVADKLMYKQYTEVKKVDFPDGIEPEVTGFTDFEWRKYWGINISDLFLLTSGKIWYISTLKIFNSKKCLRRFSNSA